LVRLKQKKQQRMHVSH